MFNLFLNAYELWGCTTPCVKQSDAAHDIQNKIWFGGFFYYLLICRVLQVLILKG